MEHVMGNEVNDLQFS